MSEEPMVIEASTVSKRIGTRDIVSDLSLSVGRGRAFALLGPNGAGKTTTVRLLTGMLAPTSGDVRLFGKALTRSSSDRLRQRIGVQTDGNTYEQLTVEENLDIWGDLYGMPAPRRAARIDELLELFRMGSRKGSVVSTLSKGMRQKVAIARAMLREPEVLFLDEPTAGLDPEASADLLEHLRAVIERRDTTMVICTHQLQGLEELVDDIGIIKGGRLLESGPTDALINARWPDHDYEVVIGRNDLERALQVVGPLVMRAEGQPLDEGCSRLQVTLGAVSAAPRLVAELVGAGMHVFEVTRARRSIRDLYFANVGEGAA